MTRKIILELDEDEIALLGYLINLPESNESLAHKIEKELDKK